MLLVSAAEPLTPAALSRKLLTAEKRLMYMSSDPSDLEKIRRMQRWWREGEHRSPEFTIFKLFKRLKQAGPDFVRNVRMAMAAETMQRFWRGYRHRVWVAQIRWFASDAYLRLREEVAIFVQRAARRAVFMTQGRACFFFSSSV